MARWTIPSPHVKCILRQCPHQQPSLELAQPTEPDCSTDSLERLPTARQPDTLTDLEGTDAAAGQFCPNGSGGGGGVVPEIFRDPYSVGGGV